MSKKASKYRIKYQQLNGLDQLLSRLGKRKDVTISRNNYLLTETDRTTWIYKKNLKGEITEVTCVSYDLLINKKWVTIIYYDSFHGGILHKHIRLFYDSGSDLVTREGVRIKGNPKSLLTWAMKDIRLRYLEYKRGFIRRNSEVFRKLIIDIY